MTARQKKLNKAYEEIMTLLYANSEPSASFQELVENAPIGEDGRKIIDYNSYVIDRELSQKLYDDVIKKYKITTKWDLNTLGFNVWLGASPRSVDKPKPEQHETNI
jgi:hypothetical protein